MQKCCIFRLTILAKMSQQADRKLVSNIKAPRLPPLGVFRHRSYAQFWFMRVIASMGLQMQAVAIGWQIYNLARDSMNIEKSAFLLGMVGLAQFVPLFFLSLIGGQAVDKYNRKIIIILALLLEVVLSATLMLSTKSPTHMAFIMIFSVAAGFGVIRAFLPPAMSALGPNLVPREELPQAIAWNSLGFQGASIIGPSVAGFLYISGAVNVYLTCLILQIIAVLVILLTQTPPQDYSKTQEKFIVLIKEGLGFVWNNKIVLGAISLDLAVVLLAGATALMPVFARDILHENAKALGILRAAPSVGAALVALILAINPIREKVGLWMFGAVCVFGLATIGFGASRVLYLSAFFLAIAGAADMISVYVRQSLMQLATPDNMRGRVGAVSTLFISASNELGEFQSGLAARFLGPVMAVILGGFGAIAVAGAWMKLFKPLKDANQFSDAQIKD